MNRAQKEVILKDLEKKIGLLVGPRQSGKTYLAKDIAKEFPNSLYLNYDNSKDRAVIKAQSWLEKTDLLILDELHKMPEWKNYLKGVFDTRPPTMRILVTGSARLDAYDRMGDSLAGRYFRHRLLPLSLAELQQVGEETTMERLLNRGGFPEPYLAQNEIEAERWRAQYTNSLLSTDVFELDSIHNFKGMRLVFELLRDRVGSPVSYQSLSEDVGISPMTVKKYIQILEALFVVFIITPYSRNIARSLLKEPKLYFFDTALVRGGEGPAFENMVALSLLKSLYAQVDEKGADYALHYLRTKDGQEVDFAIVKDQDVEVIIEAKVSDQPVSKTLRFFHERYKYPAIQLTQHLKHEHKEQTIQKLRALDYLSGLYL